ncbi:gamma-aminobutyric acid receptor alpha-like [Plakobranchus ocellatus]|uniref:Gamma-aminobutyric acid receptor alpha-like n=1 Tax=Plakobranchus ocellatus TaxID=259542 RepID=A0AAV3Y6D6_9GAST|nr:gamma-aminobutyric acid receptor alpha-like [Plakobranchus ocellatus]
MPSSRRRRSGSYNSISSISNSSSQRLLNLTISRRFLTTCAPITVNADLSLRSMGPISELDMIYTLDCYFRQRWLDTRLAMNVSLENLTLGIKILERIWHPDTVFYNGQQSYLHAITSHNRFLRIAADGTVLFSQRLTIRATCVMHLENFPMDMQQCPLLFGSFAYSTDDVRYQWRYGPGGSIELAPDLRLSQFDLVGFPLTNYTGIVKGDHSKMMSGFQVFLKARALVARLKPVTEGFLQVFGRVSIQSATSSPEKERER